MGCHGADGRKGAQRWGRACSSATPPNERRGQKNNQLMRASLHHSRSLNAVGSRMEQWHWRGRRGLRAGCLGQAAVPQRCHCSAGCSICARMAQRSNKRGQPRHPELQTGVWQVGCHGAGGGGHPALGPCMFEGRLFLHHMEDLLAGASKHAASIKVGGPMSYPPLVRARLAPSLCSTRAQAEENQALCESMSKSCRVCETCHVVCLGFLGGRGQQ